MSDLEQVLHRVAVGIFTFWMAWDAYVIAWSIIEGRRRRRR
jgi:phage shock protein PspC (stress-responsive transcriptional regulator)